METMATLHKMPKHRARLFAAAIVISAFPPVPPTALGSVPEDCATIVQLSREVLSADGVRESAENGDSMAMFALGFLSGSGENPNFTEEAKWYFKAAELNNSCAENGLGVLYANGWGVPKDPTESARWYRRAAEQGHSAAQYNLGVLYREGYGVNRDTIEAARWFTISADSGNKNAARALEVLRSNSADQATPPQ